MRSAFPRFGFIMWHLCPIFQPAPRTRTSCLLVPVWAALPTPTLRVRAMRSRAVCVTLDSKDSENPALSVQVGLVLHVPHTETWISSFSWNFRHWKFSILRLLWGSQCRIFLPNWYFPLQWWNVNFMLWGCYNLPYWHGNWPLARLSIITEQHLECSFKVSPVAINVHWSIKSEAFCQSKNRHIGTKSSEIARCVCPTWDLVGSHLPHV